MTPSYELLSVFSQRPGSEIWDVSRLLDISLEDARDSIQSHITQGYLIATPINAGSTVRVHITVTAAGKRWLTEQARRNAREGVL